MIFKIDTSLIHQSDIELPRAGGLVIVDGQGATLRLGENSNGITTPFEGSALAATSTRYLIKNFSKIVGGKKAISLHATFNSIVENVECDSQSEVGIDIRFALMSKLNNVLVTNPDKHGIYIGVGNWNGATVTNSQCNHTALEQVRVYNAKHTIGNSFNIEHSNGVTLRDCISEGHQNEGYAIYYYAPNSTVKTFEIENFHMEHAPKKGGMFLYGAGASPVSIKRLYAQKFNNAQPVIFCSHNTTLYIDNCPWWTDKMYIELSHNAPRIKISNSKHQLNLSSLKHKGRINYNFSTVTGMSN